LFMAKRNVLYADLVTRIDQSVVGMSALSENFADTLVLQTLGNERSSVHVSFLLRPNAGARTCCPTLLLESPLMIETGKSPPREEGICLIQYLSINS
jgi:hypothetical protein